MLLISTQTLLDQRNTTTTSNVPGPKTTARTPFQPRSCASERRQAKETVPCDEGLRNVRQMVGKTKLEKRRDPNFDPTAFRGKMDGLKEDLLRASDNLNDIAKTKEIVRHAGEKARAAALPSDMGESSGPVIRKRKVREPALDSASVKRSKLEESDQRRIDDFFGVSKLAQAEQHAPMPEAATEPLPPLEQISYPWDLVKGKNCRYLCRHIHEEKPVEWRYLVVTNAISTEQVGGAFCKLTTIKELRDCVGRILHRRQNMSMYHRGKFIARSADWKRLDTIKMKDKEDHELTVTSADDAKVRGWC